MGIEIIGIIVGSITAIGIGIYQVKSSKRKTLSQNKTKSQQILWDSLGSLRSYFDLEMGQELDKTGTVKFEPLHDLGRVISQIKPNLKSETYNKVNQFYTSIIQKTETGILNKMKIFIDKKEESFPNELEEIQQSVNSERIELVEEIEKFMEQIKQNLNK